MNFGDLLTSKGIDPSTVLIFRHRPTEPELNAVFPLLASQRPDVFNAYQQTQGARAEGAMKKARYVASFIGTTPGRALFVGLYEIGDSRLMTEAEYWAVPAYQEMKAFGMRGFHATSERTSLLWFDLKLTDFYDHWAGKLELNWPPPDRAWWRWANRGTFPIAAVHSVSVLDPKMPEWDEITLSFDQLKILPPPWKSRLAEWRGIYLIFDTSDSKSYVGSAYGEDNLLGRWLEYGRKGHGGNRQLLKRDPTHFRFSILQRVSPDLDPADVIRIESKWKERLHTRQPHGLNDN